MIKLESIALEVTRRCNNNCSHCMRGNSQNLDLSVDIVDNFFSNNIKIIQDLCFSGGEPTLNPNIIAYIIDKFIRNNIIVNNMVMVTNGRIFNENIIISLLRYKKIYQNSRIMINFSIDKYHKKIKKEIKERYRNYSEFFEVDDYEIDDNTILKTGNSDIGVDYSYKVDPIFFTYTEDELCIYNYLYLSANGNFSTNGMGSYEDMDKLNLGNIKNNSLIDIVNKYGEAMLVDDSYKKLRIKKEKTL